MSNLGRRFPAHPLAPDEIRAVLAACGDGWLGTRDRALVTLLWRAGLRCNEAARARAEDMRRAPGGIVFRVEHPKGAAHGAPHRELGLDPKAAAALEAWADLRGDAPGALFVTKPGLALQTSHVRRLLPRLARRAGLKRRVHPHALRHTFARELYDEGLGLVEIMLALGHARLDTTQKYLTSIGATRVVGALIRRTW